MLLATFTFTAVILTYAMFQSRSAMLGFPCGIFWSVLGGYAYTQTASFFPPTDMYAFLSIASLLGMTPFTILAAYALRTKKEEAEEGDLYFDEGGDKDVKFIDEGGEGNETELDGEKPSRRIRGIRERAAQRRSRWE